MGLFDFLSKKNAPIKDSSNPGSLLSPDGLMDLPPLPPLATGADDFNASISKQLDDLKKSSAPIQKPSAPAAMNASRHDSFDWSAPLNSEASAHNVLNAPVASHMSVQEKSPLSPEPSLTNYDPYHEEKIDPPRPEDFGISVQNSADINEHDSLDEGIINIELPGFDSDDSATPGPAPKRVAVPSHEHMKMPSQKIREQAPHITNMELAHASHINDVDVYVDVNEYARIFTSFEQSKKILSTRMNNLNSLLDLQDSEQNILHQFHLLLESDQRTLMKIDKIIFEPA